MPANMYCNFWRAPTISITTPTDLTARSSLPDGATAVFRGPGGRKAGAPKIPVFIVHKQFLKPEAAQQLATAKFKKDVARSLAREASAALLFRCRSFKLCERWLRSTATPKCVNPEFFGFAQRQDSLRHKRDADNPQRPTLLICLASPPAGVLFHSPGYPHSAVRLFPGDAILCPSLGGETCKPEGGGPASFVWLSGDPTAEHSLFAPKPSLPPEAGSPDSPSSAERPYIPQPFQSDPYHLPMNHPSSDPSAVPPAEARAARKKLARQIRKDEIITEVAEEYAPILAKYEARIAALEAGIAAERAKRGESAGQGACTGEREPVARRKSKRAREEGLGKRSKRAKRVREGENGGDGSPPRQMGRG